MTVYKLQELINSSFIENIHFFNILKYIVLKSNRAVEKKPLPERTTSILSTLSPPVADDFVSDLLIPETILRF